MSGLQKQVLELVPDHPETTTSRAIADALGTTQDTHRELRLTVQELQQVGDLSPAASVRLGVGLYLLGRSSEAVTSLKSGDGSALALFALGLAQAALAATAEASISFDAARIAGYPAGACLAAKANTLRAAGKLDEAVEAEDIHIDTWADEDEPHQLTKIKLVDTGTKEESDVDIALNLEAESQLGK